jgi:cobalt-precorrin-7 (C5)-methyltransferase
MIVVGVGCGPGMITVDAVSRLGRAGKVYGSERAIEMAKPYIPPDCQITRLKDYSRLEDLPPDAILLSTGDPMLAGLGHLGEEVVPGISSMQCAFSRLRLPLTRAVVVDAHGKDQEAARREMLEEVARGRIPFVLTEPGFDLAILADEMKGAEQDCTIIVLENLGYSDEVISFGDALHPPSTSSRLFSIILVKEA